MCYLSFAGGAAAVVTGVSFSGTQVSNGYYTSAQVPFTATNFHKLGFPTNGTEEIIFSHAVRPTPLIRPTVNFTNDPLRNTSNFGDAPGFQFSYQFVFADGSESPISVYSTSAFPRQLLLRVTTQPLTISPSTFVRSEYQRSILRNLMETLDLGTTLLL